MKKLIMIAVLNGIITLSAESSFGVQNGEVAWFDIRINNSQKAQTFYQNLFGWKFQEIFQGYLMIEKGGKGIGGMVVEKNLRRDSHGTLIYFKVGDLTSSYSKAVKLGAKTELKPTNIPGFGSYAIVRDLDLNRLALFSDKPMERK